MGGITGGLNGVNTCGYNWLYDCIDIYILIICEGACRHILIQKLYIYIYVRICICWVIV